MNIAKPSLPLSFLCLLLCTSSWLNAQTTAPAHLRYYGMAVVDCLWDDPNDSQVKSNYLDEVADFSNVAQLCVFDFNDNIVGRTQAMNNLCVQPLLSIQSIFYELVDSLAPSGANHDLFPDFINRWNTFKAINASVLDTAHIASFYLVDEPVWNGISFAELDTVCALIKSDFPDIPISFVEAWPVIGQLQVPTTADWIGFDRYLVFDPQNDPAYQSDWQTLKSKLSSPHQRILMVSDAQWHPLHGAFGLSADTIAHIVQNYYDLAVMDTLVIGIVGYIWPGGLDGQGHLGMRNLPAAVQAVHDSLGKAIAGNFDPCGGTSTEAGSPNGLAFALSPNPSAGILRIDVESNDFEEGEVKIWALPGGLVKAFAWPAGCSRMEIDCGDLPAGIYAISLETASKQLETKLWCRE